jgi:hypothetical protein
MATTLNAYEGSTWYVAVAAPSESTLKSNVVTDVFNDHGVAANFNISTYGPRPSSYPANRSIAHWVAIYGYTGSGSTIKWADPAFNGVNVSWNLPSAYLSDSSANVTSYVNARGIVW